MESDADGFIIKFLQEQQASEMVTVLYPICKNQFIMYQLIHEKEGIRKLYESCYRDNLHSLWAGQELYRKGNSEEEFINILEKNMQPVYDSARRQGYEVWNRG